MKCPKCGRDMEPGYLQSGGAVDSITWSSKVLPFGLAYWKKDALTVSSEGIGVVSIPTHICKQCKLLLGDYSQST